LEASRPDVRQTGYELQVSGDAAFSDVISSGFVAASSPVAAPWPAPPLESRETRYARVRAWTPAGRTDWSETLRIEAALLHATDWTARPVSPLGNVGRRAPGPAAILRCAFHLERPVLSARLYLTALGVHETWVNGRRVGDAVLDPGWTAYADRLLYAAYDVTGELSPGENILAAAVGDGWWRGNLTWMERRAVYGETTALLAQLEILFDDGSRRVVGTDAAWRGSTGAVVAADLYNGSTVDLRREPVGWRLPGFDDRAWQAVETLGLPQGLELRPMPPVRVVDAWAVELRPSGWGTLIGDAGQNVAGYVRLRARGAPGANIRVRHAEVLDSDGRLYTAALRNAKATDTYVLADDAAAALEPPFTFHGFRYVEVAADPGVVIEAAEICVLSSDLPQTGRFACSDARLDRLFENVRWSQRGNFLALPTDCPQRDERMGWTGDIQVFAPTACANADARTFLGSWLKDLALEQRADGCVPATVPNVIPDHPFAFGAVGWGDAASLTPWALYEAYGDPGVLAQQYTSMRSWVDWCASRRGANGLWTGDFQLGDWLDPGAPSDNPHLATTHRDYIANAYLAHSASTLARAARRLGRAEDAASYAQLSREVAEATWARWRDHALSTQAGCAMAVMFEIAPAAEVRAIAGQLARLVDRNGGRIATGFLGTPLVLPALTRGGEIEAAYRLLMNEDCPGWLYQVKLGATTMWERWDAIRPDGSLHVGTMDVAEGSTMTSFNHYAYGAVAEWLYRSVAGIAPDADEPGYAGVVFAPQPGGGLTEASASVLTPYGRAAIAWTVEDQALSVALEIPPGANGRFVSPAGWTLRGADAAGRLPSGVHDLRLARQI
jgi:alpha-L-rhamnosidase